MVIWIIGMSASGKTTLGKKIYELWKEKNSNTVLVDGDEIRRIFNHDRSEDAYTLEGRKKNAERIRELCAWLDRQEINVVCCILSIFEESHEWNRQNLSKYFEVAIQVPMEKLQERETKGLYARALNGEQKNVVGVDIPFVAPLHPDYFFDNSSDTNNLAEEAQKILALAFKK